LVFRGAASPPPLATGPAELGKLLGEPLASSREQHRRAARCRARARTTALGAALEKSLLVLHWHGAGGLNWRRALARS
jgi:hypothetical protein